VKFFYGGRAAAAMEAMRRFGTESLPKKQIDKRMGRAAAAMEVMRRFGTKSADPKSIALTHIAHSDTIALIVSNDFLVCTRPP